jgi:hypothetical protein
MKTKRTDCQNHLPLHLSLYCSRLMAKCTANLIVVVDCYLDDDCWIALVQCSQMHTEKNIVAVRAKMTEKCLTIKISSEIQQVCWSSKEINPVADEPNMYIRNQSAGFISSEKWHGPTGKKSSQYFFSGTKQGLYNESESDIFLTRKLDINVSSAENKKGSDREKRNLWRSMHL